MFLHEKPIEKSEDDILDRKVFSERLGQALLDWKENDSLVLALYGSWGSGKTSIINMAREYIYNKKEESKPIVIDFNPWMFSETDKLVNHFFEEIAKGIEWQGKSEKDLILAKKLKNYSNLINLIPTEDDFLSLKNQIFAILALLGIGINNVILLINNIAWLRITINVLIAIFVILQIFSNYFKKWSELIKENYSDENRTALEMKKEIIKNLKERKEKIIIVIDDIDRLNKMEQRQIFRLIRANADFPNTIYLLAFDKNIIDKNLADENRELEEKFLEKIIQVNFDIPYCNPQKIQAFLLKELDRILGVLPSSITKHFDNSDTYWINVYHSGFKNFFKNIRDVKRYISGLEFNINQLVNNGVLEVNPIDFIAIESVRNFVPDFYAFMRNKNQIFTKVDGDLMSRTNYERESRRSEINLMISNLKEEYRENLKNLIFTLFPQVKGICDGSGNTYYGYESQKEWTKKLRICATKNFDAYFSLIPAGDYEEINQFEMQSLFSILNDKSLLKERIKEFINIKKIDKLFDLLQYYTDDKEKIKSSDAKNLVVSLFDIFDELPKDKEGAFEFGNDITIARIVFQLLKREESEDERYSILNNAINETISNYIPAYYISLEERKNEKEDASGVIISNDNFSKLKEICVNKLINQKEKLIHEKKLISLMYILRGWDQQELLNYIISEIQKDDEKIIDFIYKTVYKTYINSWGDYGTKVKEKIGYKNISEFMDIEEIKIRIEKIKENSQLYEKHNYIIEKFLNDYNTKDKDNFFDD